MKNVNVEKEKKLVRLLLQNDVSSHIISILESSIEIAYIEGKLEILREKQK